MESAREYDCAGSEGDSWRRIVDKQEAEKNDDLTKPNTDLELCGLQIRRNERPRKYTESQGKKSLEKGKKGKGKQ